MEYPLQDYAAFIHYNNIKCGLILRCPNCGVAMSAWFENPIGGEPTPGSRPVTWKRTGETLETLSLHPSFMAFNHYHSWITDGKLCVDSSFQCIPEQVARKAESDALFERLKESR